MKSFYKKRFKKIIIFLAIVGLVFGLLTVFIHFKIKNKIENSNVISCKNISLNIFLGSLDLEEVKLKKFLNKSQLLIIKSDKLNVEGLNYWSFLWNKKIRINNLILNNCDVKIEPHKDKHTHKEDSLNKNNPKSIFVGTIQLNNGKFNLNNERFHEIYLDSINTKIENFRFSPKSKKNTFNWKNVFLSASNLRVNDKANDYIFSLKNLRMESDEKLTVTDFKVKAKRSKEDFVKPFTYRKGRLDIQVPNIVVNGFKSRELILEKKIIASNISITDGFLNAFVDKSKELDPDRVRKYFYEQLISAKIKFSIDTIFLKNSKIVYEERVEFNPEFGQIHWSEVNAKIYDVTNMLSVKKNNMHMQITAHLSGESNIRLDCRFPNYNAENDYRFKGSVDYVDLKNLNSFLVFSKSIRVVKGNVSKLIFNGRGNLQSSSGDMQLYYEGLELSFLKTNFVTRGSLSKLANLLMTNKNNPNNKNKLRTGRIYSERHLEKTFIPNFWKTIESGLKSTVLPNLILPEELDVDKEKKKKQSRNEESMSK